MKPVDDCISAYGITGLLKLILDNVPAMCPCGTHEQVDGTLGHAVSANTYTAGDIVRLVSINGSASILFGPGPMGTANVHLPADTPEYFHVRYDTLISVNIFIISSCPSTNVISP